MTSLLIAAGIAFFTGLAAWKYGFGPWLKEEPVEPPEPVPTPQPSSEPPPIEQPPPLPQVLSFATPKEAWHAVRVLCDEAGLTSQEKDLICAVLYQESRFSNKAVNKNPKSTDYGIAQINDRFHIGPGKAFPSVDYVLSHPDKVIQWMIRQYKLGNLHWWVAYSSGAYRAWLKPSSPMWQLAAS